MKNRAFDIKLHQIVSPEASIIFIGDFYIYHKWDSDKCNIAANLLSTNDVTSLSKNARSRQENIYWIISIVTCLVKYIAFL